LIRTLFVWTKKRKINTTVLIEHRQAKTTRVLTQEQHLAWLKELLSGECGDNFFDGGTMIPR
jgi:hypothetical protein